jgi:hypothetical protein
MLKLLMLSSFKINLRISFYSTTIFAGPKKVVCSLNMSKNGHIYVVDDTHLSLQVQWTCAVCSLRTCIDYIRYGYVSNF